MSPPKFAKHWARQLGASEASLVQLQGGINNRVYRCGNGSNVHVIKGYSPVVDGQRDRMQAEVEFLTYAAEVAPQYVPRLMGVDTSLRCVVLEYLQGETYPEGVAPAASDIAAAVDFLRRLNADREAARHCIRMDAAEGFLRLTEHIANVRERVAGMRTDHLPRATQTEAVALLDRVQEATERMGSRTVALIDNGVLPDSIAADQRYVSPSDFGFHNALRTATGVKFFDFEFAGWDDPAKVAVDFILQPHVPTRNLASPILNALDDNKRPNVQARCVLMGPVLRLKWVCILLAVLHPERLAQLQTTHPKTDVSVTIQQRFKSATKYLQEVSPFGLH